MSETKHNSQISNKAWELFNAKNYDEAIIFFIKSNAQKKFWYTEYGLGWALFYKRKYNEAQEVFKSSIKLRAYWHSYYGLASCLFRLREFEQSIYNFHCSLKLKDNWSTCEGLGWALFNTNEFVNAIYFFKKSIKQKKNYDSYIGLGWCYFKTGFSKESIEAFYKALELQEVWDSYLGLGSAFLESKQNRKAIYFFQKSLELKENPNSYQGMGTAYINQRKYNEAIISFKKALALREEWVSYQGLGWALVKNQQYEKSIPMFKKSVEMNKDWNSYRGIGYAYFKLSIFKEAIKAFKLSIGLMEYYDSYRLLGISQNKEGYKYDSIINFKKSLIIKKDHSILAYIDSSIKKLDESDFSLLYELLKILNKSYIYNFNVNNNIFNTNFLELLQTQLESKNINPLIPYRISKEIDYFTKEKVYKTEEVRIDLRKIAKLKMEPKFNNKKILSFGDSHGYIFSSNESIEHKHVNAGTAYQINNRKSTSGANYNILNSLKGYEPKNTIIILTFGEIDLRGHIQKQSWIQNLLPEIIIRDIISRYMDFVDYLLHHGYEVCINGPHCGGGEGQVGIAIEELNHYCNLFNFFLEKECDKREVNFATLMDIAINQVSKKNNSYIYRDPHHLMLPSTDIGKGLQNILLERLRLFSFSNSEDINFLKSNNICSPFIETLNIIYKILKSNIPGWQDVDYAVSTNEFISNEKITFNTKQYIFLEFPFPISLKEVNLLFHYQSEQPTIESICYAIYEDCNPFKKNQKNVFQSKGIVLNLDNESNLICSHNFNQYNSSHKYCKYLFITISGAATSILRSIKFFQAESKK